MKILDSTIFLKQLQRRGLEPFGLDLTVSEPRATTFLLQCFCFPFSVGVPDTFVSQMLGHSRTNIPHTYAKANDEFRRAAISKLEALREMHAYKTKFYVSVKTRVRLITSVYQARIEFIVDSMGKT
jgi:hypothetical protein